MKSIEIILRAIIVSEGKLLLCMNPRTKTYYLPGGHLEFGESFDEALRREMREEIGREIGEVQVLTVIENFYSRDGKELHEVNIMTRTEILGEQPESIRSLEEHITYVWAPLSELSTLTILPEAIQRYAAGLLKV